MTKTQKYNIVLDYMEYKTVDDKRESIPVYKDTLDEYKDIKDYLFHDIQMTMAENDRIPFEQSYSIMYDALALLSDSTDNVEELEDYDVFDAVDIASIYYVEQLAYLNTGNMYAIADLVRDYNCTDVASACAIWYESTVKDWAMTIKNYILE